MPVETHAPKIVNRAATVSPAAVSRSVQCKPVQNRVTPHVQASLKVSSPKDPAEKEAEGTARHIMRMAVPESSVAYVRTESGGVFRKMEGEEKQLQRFESPYIARFAGCIPMRKAEGQPNVASNVAAEIQSATAGGSSLPLSVRRFMEPRFRADFSKVKIHTDNKAAKLNRQVNAQAFAVGNSIFFGEDKFKPDTHEGKALIAHELTHTIQQGAAAQDGSVRRSPDTTISSNSGAQVQRDGLFDIPDPRSWFAGKAAGIPGFTMLTVIIGFNPITNASVDRSPRNILEGALNMIPVIGSKISEALNNHKVFDKVSAWASTQFDALKGIGSSIAAAVDQFIAGLNLTDLASPVALWKRAKSIATDPIDRIKAFAAGLVSGLIELIKDAILKPLAALAKSASPQGYDLLCAILGKDPISGESVTSDPESIVSAFLTFIGETETLAKIKQAKAIPRIITWFKGAMSELKGFVNEIPGLFLQAFKSLGIVDIILVPLALAKVVGVFGSFAGRFITWGGQKIWNLLEIIFDVVSPGAWGYIQKTGAALKSILKNPLPFVGNLVKAAKTGFLNFGANFLEHLKRGLIEWLIGSLPGVYIPKAITLAEVGKFALSVLGITWAQIRGKIVKALGPSGEKIMAGLEVAFDVVKALVTGGPAAVWEIIKDKLNDLKDQVISGITSFIIEAVVSKAVPKLITMFIPGAGFISAIISIYDTVMVFVAKISKIIQVVTGFINSIVAIAAGQIGAAAAKVESILGGLLSLAISFLAGFVGLGKVADEVTGIVKKVQTVVDKALDAAIAWIIGKAKALFAKLFGKKDKKDDRTDKEKQRDKLAAIAAAEGLLSPDGFDEKLVRGKLGPIKTSYKLLTLDMVVDSKTDDTETVHFTASASEEEIGKPKQVKLAAAGPVTPVPVGSWIKAITTGSFEQVASSATVLRRAADGVQTPVSFSTFNPSGGGGIFSYRREGKDWELTPFKHGSNHAVPVGAGKFELKSSSQGQEFIRQTFYADTGSSRNVIKAARLPSLRNPANKSEFLSEGSPSDEAAQGYTKKDPVTGKALVPVSVASPDHDPPIASHWTHKDTGGNNAVQATRLSWNTNPATFKIMSLALNLSLGSRGATYTKEVGMNFRGPGE